MIESNRRNNIVPSGLKGPSNFSCLSYIKENRLSQSKVFGNRISQK